MTPQEALAYGLIDEVIKTKGPQPVAKIPSLRVPPPLSIYDLGNISNKPPRSGGGLGRDELKRTWS